MVFLNLSKFKELKTGLIDRPLTLGNIGRRHGTQSMDDLIGYSNTYRIALGPGAGRKAFTLQTVPMRQAETHPPPPGRRRRLDPPRRRGC
jgi:hypothetical protein